MARAPLTEREAEALSIIDRFIKKNGWAPSLEELGMLLGLRSKSWAHPLVTELKKKGYVTVGKGPRQLRLNPPEPPGDDEPKP